MCESNFQSMGSVPYASEVRKAGIKTKGLQASLPPHHQLYLEPHMVPWFTELCTCHTTL